jgi:hypothetical protein
MAGGCFKKEVDFSFRSLYLCTDHLGGPFPADEKPEGWHQGWNCKRLPLKDMVAVGYWGILHKPKA